MRIQKLLLKTLLLAFTGSLLAETTTYFVNDIYGSPVAAMDQDGNSLWKESYNPYGEKRIKSSLSENDTGFTGHQSDKSTGLTYMQARYYDPILARFYSIDPVGPKSHLKEGNVQGFNRYSYAYNNPYKYIDPDGRAPNQAGTTSINNIMAEIQNYEKNGIVNAAALGMLSKNHGGNMGRYLYTEKYGWVDVRHFGKAAQIAATAGSVTTETLGFFNEVVQFASEWGDDYRSGFSPEDISSNAAGASFGDDYLNGESSASESLSKWFKDVGAKDPNDPAAGKDKLPLVDPAHKNKGGDRGSSNLSNSNGPGAVACPDGASSCS